jgi:CheY-like chemotaxis protein
MMDRQLVHLVRLIDDLLDVSRVSQGKIELRNERIKVGKVIDAAVEASRPMIDFAKHSLTIDVPSDSLWIDADLTRLSQVVANLLNNAAKYTPAGGRIGVSVQTVDNDVLIEVSDNGVGIPTEMRSKVFQLFAQVDNHLDRAQGGLGIGLALVKQLVVMHGGTVDAKSAGAGKGSVFSVRIPIASSPEPATSHQEITTEPVSEAALRVLVVDDNVDVAQTVGWMLEAIGHDHRLVHDGRHALQTAREFRPDVVLLDIGLPGMDGYEVCRAFRQDELFKSTPIIAQTGWGQDRDKKLASEAGFDHHLTKPVALADLEKLLASIAAQGVAPLS